MKLKIIMFLISIVLFCSGSSSVYAQDNTEPNDNNVWIEDGESFDFLGFDEVLKSGNIAEAESIYSEWVAKRKKMLDNGSKFGLLDMVIKHKYARIQYEKENYEECIAIEKEIEGYLRANINESADTYLDWKDQICKSLLYQARSYYLLGIYQSGIDKYNDLLEIIENDDDFIEENRINVQSQLMLVYLTLGETQKVIEIGEETLPKAEKIFGTNSEMTYNVSRYLFDAYSKTSRYIDAVNVGEKLLNSIIALYGENSEETLKFQNVLWDTYFVLGKTDEAKKILEKILPIAENLSDDSKIKQDIFFSIGRYFQYWKVFSLFRTI